MIDAQRVDFVAIPTRDRERAVRFYGETLGLERNPNSNGLLLHHRYAPYADGSTP